jgi:hypothetical protein
LHYIGKRAPNAAFTALALADLRITADSYPENRLERLLAYPAD